MSTSREEDATATLISLLTSATIKYASNQQIGEVLQEHLNNFDIDVKRLSNHLEELRKQDKKSYERVKKELKELADPNVEMSQSACAQNCYLLLASLKINVGHDSSEYLYQAFNNASRRKAYNQVDLNPNLERVISQMSLAGLNQFTDYIRVQSGFSRVLAEILPYLTERLAGEPMSSRLTATLDVVLPMSDYIRDDRDEVEGSIAKLLVIRYNNAAFKDESEKIAVLREIKKHYDISKEHLEAASTTRTEESQERRYSDSTSSQESSDSENEIGVSVKELERELKALFATIGRPQTTATLSSSVLVNKLFNPVDARGPSFIDPSKIGEGSLIQHQGKKNRG